MTKEDEKINLCIDEIVKWTNEEMDEKIKVSFKVIPDSPYDTKETIDISKNSVKLGDWRKVVGDGWILENYTFLYGDGRREGYYESKRDTCPYGRQLVERWHKEIKPKIVETVQKERDFQNLINDFKA